MNAGESQNPGGGGTAEAGLTLAGLLRDVPGVGGKVADLFERLEVRTVADLVKHLPHRYEFEASETPIAKLTMDAIGTARGELLSCRYVRHRTGGPRGVNGRFEVVMTDDTGRLEVVWFNAGYLADKLKPGMRIIVLGKVKRYNDGRQMVNPQWRYVPEEESGQGAQAVQERLRPVYGATENLTTHQIEKIVRRVLPRVADQIEDHLEPAFRARNNLMELRRAYEVLHTPRDEQEVKEARRRLAYDELLMVQLGFAIKRKHTATTLTAPELRWNQAIDKQIRKRFPFELTEGQSKVIKEIAEDLRQGRPMNRLVQGDVGSGKTVVALYGLLMAVMSGKQGAMMAPTELLAEQHHHSIQRMLEGAAVKVGLLTGSQSRAEREILLRRIESGEVNLVIGTQALLTGSVVFSDLAVVVVDEQHSFGVLQRAAIRSKSQAENPSIAPHYLVMTATPIPRTMSLTVFGDLDVSTILGLPPGRKPIVTRVVGPEESEKVYGYLAQRVGQGEQAYVVLPAIEESVQGLKAVRSHARMLQEKHFPDLRVAALHGQIKPMLRERIMDRFRRGVIQVLVATTVIEVGVDVPNASLMVVEHAERFGLAQLHQLRGRVGRGANRSLCVFIAETTTPEAEQLMAAIARTTDGFAIAEADLMIRGMGDIFGTRQSGSSPFRVARIPEDLPLLMLARRDAQALVDEDPKLTRKANLLLRARLLKLYGNSIGLGDVA